MNELFSKYGSKGVNEECSGPGLHPQNPDVPCSFDLSVLGECQSTEKTILEGKLCLYLKINRVCLDVLHVFHKYIRCMYGISYYSYTFLPINGMMCDLSVVGIHKF